MKRFQVSLAKDLQVSIVEHSKDKYELAVLYKKGFNEWDLDYSVFEDVLYAYSEMEVYGTIQRIVSQYSDKYDIEFTY